MAVQKDTIKELWIGRPTHATVELMRIDLAKKAATINTCYDPFTEETRYGFAAAIMMSEDYRKRVTKIDAAWTFQVPDIPVTYDPIINGPTSETKKAKREADWEVHQEVHEVYPGL